MQKENIKIIGLGGVGSILTENLSRYLEYNKTKEFCLTLIDGDSYEDKNRGRQVFSRLGNKAKVKKNDMQGLFPVLTFEDFKEFVDNTNVADCIEDGDVVFSCVDNHKTRKIISDHTSKLNNVILISGGNEWTDGNVQIYVRKEGKNLTPTITDYHPEIANPADQLPNEMSCEELAQSDPQLLFTNLSVATIMCWAYYNVVEKEAFKQFEVLTSEVYFDIEQMALNAVTRNPKS